MFQVAHSLGYPHPDLMLEQMTAMQTRELMMFFRVTTEEKERLEAEAADKRLKQFFSRKIALQERENG